MSGRDIWLGLCVASCVLAAPQRASAQAAERKNFTDALVAPSAAPPTSSSPYKAKLKPKVYNFSDGTVDGKLGSRRMRRANRFAARILRQRMQRRRPNDLRLLREAAAADVIVVRGSYDRVQDVLRAVKVKHVVVPPRLLPRLPLFSTQTLMINCPGRLGAAGVRKVRHFVRTGGHLVTTDWALTVVARAFPGTITRGGRNTKNDVVKVKFLDYKNALLKHARAAKVAPRWWLETGSYPIRVLAPRKVKVLITSNEMKRKYGAAPIAVSFRFHDGKVLHMTSHFYLQQAKLRGRRERAKGSAFAKAAGLSSAQVARLKKQGLEKVRAGALNAAYAMQQVTANVLVDKARANKRLLSKFKARAKRGFRLDRAQRPSASPPQKRSAAVTGTSMGKGKGKGRAARRDSRAGVRKGFMLRVLQRKGKRVKVRDLLGNEGWTDESNLL
ncbi:MAG: hypothetical protein KC503_21050 [Myxococcales bacterium]|nr:hypothetical protein [Myxococcales bacterium]